MSERGPHRVLVGGRMLLLTAHAVERYVERVKQLHSYDQALGELTRILQGCEMVAERPAWAVGDRRTEGWVVLADGIVFPVLGGRLMTCMTRSEVGPELRVVREPRGDRERRVRKRRKPHGKVARDERRRARAAREAME